MAEPRVYDLAVVGSGPTGMAVSIGGGSERLRTVVLECGELGGQAGQSSNIRNYPGFPGGISGGALMSRMLDQAAEFNTEIEAPVRADGIERQDGGLLVKTDVGETYLGGAVLLSCGVTYRRLRATNLALWLGRGAEYGSPERSELDEYKGKQVAVIGGANSAGQAAMLLSENEDSTVHMLVRADSLERRMSGYLVDDIGAADNIEVHTETELVAVRGEEGRLTTAVVMHQGTEEEMAVDALFVMIGAEPRTHWLPAEVERDKDGFVVAGTDLSDEARARFMEQTGGQAPLEYETSMPGLFAAGDVRCGTQKRVAAAVGEGTGAIHALHRYYEQLKSGRRL